MTELMVSTVSVCNIIPPPPVSVFLLVLTHPVLMHPVCCVLTEPVTELHHHHRATSCLTLLRTDA